MDGWNTTFLLGSPIFRGYVSFRDGMMCIVILTWFYILSEIIRRSWGVTSRNWDWEVFFFGGGGVVLFSPKNACYSTYIYIYIEVIRNTWMTLVVIMITVWSIYFHTSLWWDAMGPFHTHPYTVPLLSRPLRSHENRSYTVKVTWVFRFPYAVWMG